MTIVTAERVLSRADSIRQEERTRFEKHILPGVIGLWLTALLMAGAVLWVTPSLAKLAWGWAGVFTLLMLLTVLIWLSYGKHVLLAHQRDRWHEWMVIAHALMWMAAPMIFYAPGQDGQQLVTLFLVCMVCGFSAGAVPIFGTRPRLYLLMFVPIYGAQIVVFGWHGLRYGDGFHLLMAAAMVLLLVVNLMFSRFTWGTFRSAIELAYDNDELVRQLQSQTQELAEQTRVAQEANTAKTKFLAAASHDLRQPVHALNLFVEVLSGTDLDAKQSMMVQHIRAATQASGEMLNTLLDYSRIEAGVMTPNPKRVPLAPLLRALEDEFGPQADSKRLIYRTRDTDAAALCDPVMTKLILRNFVSNALRYTLQGGVLIGVRRQGEQLLVQVIDTGVGIAREHWEEVFKEFRQLGNEERDRQKGLGLGLAIAKGLAQSMGAAIELQSRPGRGSIFTLRLPQAQAAVAMPVKSVLQRSGGWMTTSLSAAAESFKASPQASEGNMSLARVRALVVDDEEAVRLSMQALLQSWGCDVRAADGPQEALALLEGGFLPQILITDYRLREGITGANVIAALRDAVASRLGVQATAQALPAIIVTGDTAPERIREAAQQTAVLLHKPVQAHDLQAAMREVLLA